MNPKGLIIIENFILQQEEDILVREILSEDRPTFEKTHLKFSNTKQQEYGKQINDKMEINDKLPKISMPENITNLFNKIKNKLIELNINNFNDNNVFCRMNHYYKKTGNYMHKHMDSKKTFGSVIVCCSLLSDVKMNFYNTKGNSYGMAKVYEKIEVDIPRYSLYIMSGESRSEWQHGIRKDQCMNERISLTFRTIKDDAPKV